MAGRTRVLLFTLFFHFSPLDAGEVQRNFDISENTAPGTVVGFLDQNPPSDEKDSYLVVFPPESGAQETFSVNTKTGEIRTRKALDFEQKQLYVFLAIPDGGNGIRVTISVLDVNDNAPIFPVAVFDVQLSEYARLNAEMPLPSATDRDSGLYTVQRYRIASGNVNNAFRLSTKHLNGVLYLDLIVNAELDREFRDSYKLQIEALDGGDPPLSARLLVNVTIIDGNDNAPQFTQPRYLAQILQNKTVGSSVIAVKAIDKDIGPNGQVEYRLLPNPSQSHRRFAINSRSGLITVSEPLTLYSTSSYELVVIARDQGLQALESTAFVTVTVLNARETGSEIKVIFLSSDGSATVNEGAEIGDLVARVSVSDPDFQSDKPKPVNMSVSGGEGHFGLQATDKAVYMLVLSKRLDREATPRFLLTLIATDSKGRLARKNITLIVGDINDNPPQFTQALYEAEVREKSGTGASVVQVTALDLDKGENARITYAIAQDSPYKDWFEIDSETGLITSLQSVDCEVSSSPELTVIATDNGQPQLSATAKVLISVLDVNDNGPLFQRSIYKTNLTEDAPVGTCFLKVKAVDPDCGVNALVQYSIADEAEKPKEFFSIDPTSGTLCLISELDYEQRRSFQFSVVAHDGGGLSSSTLVQIQVLDVDDNAPVFYPSVYNVSIRQDIQSGLFPLLVVSATDRDGGINGQITYSIATGNERGLFSLDEHKGELYVRGPLHPAIHHLTVDAEDGGHLKSLQPASISITILRPDYPSPVFERKTDLFSLREDTLPGIEIGRVRATGPGTITYGIYSGDPENQFSIDASSGVLTVKQYLDAEKQSSLLLNIQASVGRPPSYNHTQVKIVIEDVNDNGPQFETSRIRTSVREDQLLDIPFFQVQATDPDKDRNGEITYRLIRTTPTAPFILRPLSGELLLSGQLDYETVRSYELVIGAFDGGIPTRSANITLELAVLDANDNGPIFSSDLHETEVAEDAAPLTRLVQVEATDVDSGQNGQLHYSIENSTGLFGVMADSGWLYVRKALDRESQAEHVLTIVVRDGGEVQRSASAQVRVRVLDVNDNAPDCETVSDLEIVENNYIGQLVGVVTALDRDEGLNGTVFYSLESTLKGTFRIEPSGELYADRVLDSDSQSEYHLSVIAQDNAQRPLSSTCTVSVHVLDQNDNDPFFVLPHQNKFVVREEQPVGTEILQVRANDPDKGLNGSVKYSLVSSTAVNYFAIDADSGVLSTLTVLNFEALPSPLFELQIRASDQGNPRRSAIKAIVIEVLDITDGDNTLASMINRTVTFRASESTLVGQELGAVDPDRIGVMADKGTRPNIDPTLLDVTYEIVSGNSQGLFEIDRVSSLLYLVGKLDFETSPVHVLKVSKTDLSRPAVPISSVFEAKIVVLDENDNAPVFPTDPVIFSVPENAPPGQVVWTFNATDKDVGVNGRIEYKIIEALPENVFELDAVTGELWLTDGSLSPPLDHERCNEYHLIVAASDKAPEVTKRRTTRVTSRIYVTDVNDNGPVFVSQNNLEVFEDEPVGYPLIHVVATDLDYRENGRVKYKLESGNEEAHFALNETTGALSLRRRLDRHSSRQFSLRIKASDQGTPTLTAYQTLTVSVKNVNEQAPRFEQSVYKSNVTENQPAGSFVTQLKAGNKAAGANHQITYILPLGIGREKFRLDEKTGILETKAVLDREERGEYVLTVYAKDSSYPVRYDAAKVIVSVLDQNDNKPELAKASCLPLTVPENQKIDQLHVFLALDEDSGLNGRITYAIEAGNVDGKFHINPSSGQLSCEELDREAVASYSLTIVARDSGIPSLSTTCTIKVEVLDENDQAPTFERLSYQVDVSEDTLPDTTILQLTAKDGDQGNNAEITYSLANDTSGIFEIDPHTGSLVTVRSLDFEKERQYTLAVKATDHGATVARSSHVTVTIRILDRNDNWPQFTKVPLVVTVPTEVPLGHRIVKLTATDADGPGLNSDIVYGFSQPTEDEFAINPSTGVISAKRTLEYQDGFSRYISVVASDQGSPSHTATGVVQIRAALPGQDTDIQQSPFDLVFDQELYRVQLDEKSRGGSPVVNCRARRVNGDSQQIEYKIVSGNEANAMRIDSWSGDIFVSNSAALDYEKQPVFQLLIEASSLKDGPGRQYLSYAIVFVELRDLNDHQPQFLQQRYSTAVWEGKPRGTFVIQVSAMDRDTGRNSQISYSIVSGNLDQAFTIDSTGTVRTDMQLDREIQHSYSLGVMATDAGHTLKSGSTTVDVQVIDVNDNKPSFPPINPVEVSESTPVGSLLAIVTANDVDTSPALVYTLLPDAAAGNPELMFGLDRFTGRLTLLKPLDYEQRVEYSLPIEASDGEHSTTTLLKVRVLDENDNEPVFEQPYYHVSLPEDTPSGTSIIQVRATDTDAGGNSRLIYRLLPETVPTKPAFWIDKHTGSVFTNSSVSSADLNAGLVQLTVEASDDGNPPKVSTTSIQVQLVRRTERKQPKFLNDFYKFEAYENATVHGVIGNLSVNAAGNSALVYRIDSGDTQHRFRIDSKGRVMLANALDREEREEYRLQVSVHTKDNSVTNSSAVVIVNVLDVNDNVPSFAQNQKMLLEIGEKTAIGDNLLKLTATDRDIGLNGQVKYEITSGNEDGTFNLDPDTGVLSLAKRFQSLLPQVRLVVKASDHGQPPKSTITTVLVSQLKGNEYAPFFPMPLYLGRIPESAPKGTPVFTAKATDKDGNEANVIRYALQDAKDSGALKKFSVNPLTGVVRTADFLDYEAVDTYYFTVTAKDSGGRSSVVPAQVLVQGVDEFAPIFAQPKYTFQVSFDAQPGDYVGEVAATDQDSGTDGHVHYSIQENTDYFQIHPATGVITVAKNLKALSEAPIPVQQRVTRSAEEPVASPYMGPKHYSTADTTQDENSVKVLFLTIKGTSGEPSSTLQTNTTSVELQLGFFPSAADRAALAFDAKLITICSVVLVLLLICLLLCLVLRLRRNQHKQANAKKISHLKARNGSALPPLTTLSSNGSSYAPVTAAPVVALASAERKGDRLAAHHFFYENGKDPRTAESNGLLQHHHRGSARHALPPPPMPPAEPRQPLNSISNLSNRSSGRGSVTAEDEDEIRQLTSRVSNRSQLVRSMPDSGIHIFPDEDTTSMASDVVSATEYLTSLGVTEPPSVDQSTYGHNIDKVIEGGRLELLETEHDDMDVQELIYSKVNEVLAEDGQVAGTSRQLPDVRVESVSSPAPVFMTDMQLGHRPAPPPRGPAYQPLTQVFSEISKLKNEQETVSNRRRQPVVRNGPPTPTRLPLTQTVSPYASQNVESPNVWMPNFASPMYPEEHQYSNPPGYRTSDYSESDLEIKI